MNVEVKLTEAGSTGIPISKLCSTHNPVTTVFPSSRAATHIGSSCIKQENAKVRLQSTENKMSDQFN